MPNLTIRLRVIVLQLPPDTWEGRPTHFGLQDKDWKLDAGQAQPDGSRVYECTLQVKFDDDLPNFTGKYAHGTRDDRFLYLGWAYAEGGWVRRIKISLKSITKAQIEQAIANEQVLQAVVEDGTAAATIKLKDGWTLTS